MAMFNNAMFQTDDTGERIFRVDLEIINPLNNWSPEMSQVRRNLNQGEVTCSTQNMV